MSKKDNEIFERAAAGFPQDAYKKVNVGRGFLTIDAYHIVSRMTELFGLCGRGWGWQNIRYEQHDSCVAAIGEVWYVIDDVRYSIPAVGDAMIIKGNLAEAYKKAQTNLLSKASSFLGIGLSVYQGKGLDDPYLDRADSGEEQTVLKEYKYKIPATHNKFRAIYDYCADREYQIEQVEGGIEITTPVELVQLAEYKK
jgi:hypothetical protein